MKSNKQQRADGPELSYSWLHSSGSYSLFTTSLLRGSSVMAPPCGCLLAVRWLNSIGQSPVYTLTGVGNIRFTKLFGYGNRRYDSNFNKSSCFHSNMVLYQINHSNNVNSEEQASYVHYGMDKKHTSTWRDRHVFFTSSIHVCLYCGEPEDWQTGQGWICCKTVNTLWRIYSLAKYCS